MDDIGQHKQWTQKKTDNFKSKLSNKLSRQSLPKVTLVNLFRVSVSVIYDWLCKGNGKVVERTREEKEVKGEGIKKNE